MSNEPFDDMQVLRRRCLALEQANGDLGEAIGVLKQERARLWGALCEVIRQTDDPNGDFTEEQTEAALAIARAALKEIRIDK